MRNLESVAQEMSELCSVLYLKCIFFHNLLGQSIQTSMQNLESVAQEMSELWTHLN